MKFEKKITATIMDGEVVRWQGQVNWVNQPEISASRNGILICGAWPVTDEMGIDVIKNTLDEAVTAYHLLKGGEGHCLPRQD